jgi:hypothetical protein
LRTTEVGYVKEDTTQRQVTREQWAGLRANKIALAIFVYLALGLSPAQLIREFDLSAQMERSLNALQELGLIRRLSNGTVKLLVKPTGGSSWEVDHEARERK